MIAIFLLVVVMAAAAMFSREFRQQRNVVPDFSPAEDGTVVMPRPDQLPQGLKIVSDTEMKFAGQYLHLGGLALVALGIFSRLRMSGAVQTATSSGLLPCLFGLTLGLILSGVGYKMRKGEQRLVALSLLGTGLMLLAAVLGAAHFKFALIPLGGLLVSVFALVCWAGHLAMNLDSPAIAAVVLTSLFVAPAAVNFTLQESMVALVYLLSINLGVTAVAYLKRWDGFLIASLVGSYGLYFQSFGLRSPGQSLLFLVLTYGLFLVSGNLFHFWKRSASDFHLGLSMVNPILFACVSYLVLLRLPNSIALTLYSGLVVVHLGLAWWASSLEGQGPAYHEIARGNWALSLLFGTAAISFVAHIDNTSDNFGLVAALLLGQVFLLSALSRRLPAHLCDLARGGSLWALGLASFQLVALVPFMEEPTIWQTFGMLAMLLYFVLHESPQAALEGRLACNLSLACSLALAVKLTPSVSDPREELLLLGGLAAFAVLAYRRYPSTLRFYRYLPFPLGMIIGLGILQHLWRSPREIVFLLGIAALFLLQAALCGEDKELSGSRDFAIFLAAWTGFCLCLCFAQPSQSALAASLVFVLFCLSFRGSETHEALVSVMGALVGAAPLLLAYESLAHLSCLGMVAAVFGCLGHHLLKQNRWNLGVLCLGLSGLQLSRGALSFSEGPISTLLWCLLGLLVLKAVPASPRVSLPILFTAFLKYILWDTNVVRSSKGWNLTQQVDLTSLVCGALIVICFGLASRWSGDDIELKAYHTLFGLLVLIFGTTGVLVHMFGILDDFQILVSGFWAVASAGFVAYGITRTDTLFRLFGLVLLCTSIVKILAIDLWVLQAYDRATPVFLLGALMMAVSALYQWQSKSEVMICPS